MKVGIILAAGKGSRIKIKAKNKTTLAIAGKPLVQYGADLFSQTVDKTIVVVGAYAQSVRETLRDSRVEFVEQAKRLGTGHAVKVAVQYLEKQGVRPDRVFVGYGDHMMFYTPEIVKKMDKLHLQKKAVVTFVTANYSDPDLLAWGRIVRDKSGEVQAIVEQKDATKEQRKITELNAGFYCFDYQFLLQNIGKLEKSPVSGEFYVTDLIEMAIKSKLPVATCLVPFELVGIGVNTSEQLDGASRMMGGGGIN